MTTHAPIALFVYNRPVHTRQTVEALQKNVLSYESDLFIFSDAPKSEAQEKLVRDVREYVSVIQGFKSITIVRQEKNQGLANSIIGGVTSLVERFGRVIVLEDDLIVTPDFLEFMNRALDRYENDAQVVQISGYMFPVEPETGGDALFLPLTTSWGWATWKRAWALFDPDSKGYARVKNDAKLRRSFNLEGTYDYFSMLQDQLAGRVNSWAIRWYLSTFMVNGITLYPRQSLVMNIGFDGSGTHCGASKPASLQEKALFPMKNSFVLPDEVSLYPAWDQLRSKIFPPLSLWRKVKNQLGAVKAIIRKVG